MKVNKKHKDKAEDLSFIVCYIDKQKRDYANNYLKNIGKLFFVN